jgi:hypothetical protein
MSIIRTKNIAHPSADTSAITLNADGSMGGSFPYPNRNLFHNGSLLVWQRSVGALNVSASTPGYTTADRFWSYQTGTVGVTTTRVAAALARFPYAIRWGRPIGNSTTGLTALGQTLETIDSLRLAGQTVALSFYARKGTDFTASSSNVAVKLYTGKGTDQSSVNMVAGSWTTSATPIDSTATLTTTWQRFTYTATLPSDITQIGLALSWTPTGTAGPDDNVYLTGVQLEAGSVATEFEFKAIGQELANCQRYYYRNTADQSTSQFAAWSPALSTTAVECFIPLPVSMRTTPTSGGGGILALQIYGGGGLISVTSPSIEPSISSRNTLLFRAAVASGLTVGTLYRLLANSSTSAFIECSAEF